MADSLLEKLKAGTGNKKTINFPGTTTPIVVRILSEGERQAAHFATDQHFRRNEIPVSMATVDAYETEKTIQMLYRALSDEEGKPLAQTITRFAELLTIDEKSTLVEEYMAHEKDCSPNLEDLSGEEIDRIIDDIKKNRGISGNVLNINTAKQLIISLVNRLQALQQDNGSTF